MHKEELLQISISEFCNLECNFCSQYKKKSANSDVSKNLISESTLKKILQNSKHKKYNTLSLVSGGEIFFHTKAIELIKILLEFNFNNNIADNAVIYTNGVLFDNEKINDFFEILYRFPQSIRFIFSVNAFKTSTYKNITGKDLLDICIKNIIFFIEKSFEYNNKHNNLFFGVQFLVVDDNVDEAGDFKDFWSKIFLERDLSFEVITSNTNVSKNYSIIYRKAFLREQKRSDDLFKSCMKEIDVLYNEECDFYVNDSIEEYDFNMRKRPPCQALWKYPYISPEGKVTICCRDVDFEYAYSDIDQDLNKSEKLRQYKENHIRGNFRKMPLCYSCSGYEISDFSDMREIISKEFPDLFHFMLHRLDTGVFSDFKYIYAGKNSEEYQRTLEFLRFTGKTAENIVCSYEIDIDKKHFLKKINNIDYKHNCKYANFPCPYWFNVLKIKEDEFYCGCDLVDIPYNTVRLFDFDNISHLPLKCIICTERPEIDSEVLFTQAEKYLSEYSVEQGEKKRSELEALLSSKDLKKVVIFLNENYNRKLVNIFWDNLDIEYLDDKKIIDMLCSGKLGEDYYNLFSLVKNYPEDKKDSFYHLILHRLFSIYPHPTVLEYICDYSNLNGRTEFLVEFLQEIEVREYISTGMFKGEKIILTMLRILVSSCRIRLACDFIKKYIDIIKIPYDIFEKLYFLFINEKIKVYDFFLFVDFYMKENIPEVFEFLSKDIKNIKQSSIYWILEEFTDYIINCDDFDKFAGHINKRKDICHKYLHILCNQGSVEKLIVFVNNSFIKFNKYESEKILNSIIYSQKYSLLKDIDNSKLEMPEFFNFDFVYNIFVTNKIKFDDILSIIKKTPENKYTKFYRYISVDFSKLSFESRIDFLRFLSKDKENRSNILQNIILNLEENSEFDNFFECYMADDEIILDKSHIELLKDIFYSKDIKKDNILFIVEKYIKKTLSVEVFREWEKIFIDSNFFIMWNSLTAILDVKPDNTCFDKLYFAFCSNNSDNRELLNIITDLFAEKTDFLIHSIRKDMQMFNNSTKNIILQKFGEEIVPEAVEDKFLMQKIRELFKNRDNSSLLNILLSDSRINPDLEILQYLWDFFLEQNDFEVLKKIIERFPEFKPDILDNVINIDLIDNIFLKMFFVSKLFPEMKKNCLKNIIDNIKNIDLIDRLIFIAEFKKDVEEAGMLEYFADRLWEERLYYSFFKNDFYLSDRFTSELDNVKVLRLALLTGIKKKDNGILRRVSGIYQKRSDFRKALIVYRKMSDDHRKDIQNIKTLIFLYEKNNMIFKAFTQNFKLINKAPLFFIKKNIYFMLKYLKIK